MTADRAREMLATGLDDIAALNIRKHGDDPRLSVSVPHALSVIEQLVEAIDEASEALDRLTTVSAHMLNQSDEVRKMAAFSGGFWAQRAINAERQRDEALQSADEVRAEEKERCAQVAERDADWSRFAKKGIEPWEDGHDGYRDYRLGIAVGSVIANAIRSAPSRSGGEEEHG